MKPEIKKKILTHITGAGFAEGWTSSCQDPAGLPGEREVCVLPKYSFGDGPSTVVVSATYAQQWFRPCPFNFTTWEPRGSRVPYATPAELTVALERLCHKPCGCW